MKTVTATKLATSATTIAAAFSASTVAATHSSSSLSSTPTPLLPSSIVSSKPLQLSHRKEHENHQNHVRTNVDWICCRYVNEIPRGGGKHDSDQNNHHKRFESSNDSEQKNTEKKSSKPRRKKRSERSRQNLNSPEASSSNDQQMEGDENSVKNGQHADSKRPMPNTDADKSNQKNSGSNATTNKIVEEILQHGDDFYQVLGVSRTATETEIKKAYRKRAVQTHPDKTRGDRRAFDKVSEAHDVLTDSTKKQLYDQFGKRGLDPQGPPGGGMPKSAQDIFRSMFQQQQRQAPRQNQTVRYQLQVSLEELYQGVTQSITVGPPNRHHLHSHGRHRHQKRVQVHIPKGSISGQSIVLSGEMDFSEKETPGDLVFMLTQLPHPTFTRKGNDLAVEITITLEEAICGVERSIKHLDGREIWIASARQKDRHPEGHDNHIPGNQTETTPGTPLFIQNGDVQVLKGQGMPKRDDPNNEFGDLYVQYRVQMPKPSKQGTMSLTDEERKELARLLAKLEGSSKPTLSPLRRRENRHSHHEPGEELHYLQPASSADFGRASGRVTLDEDEHHHPVDDEYPSHSFFGSSNSNFYFGSNFGHAFGGSGGSPFDDNDDSNVQCQQM